MENLGYSSIYIQRSGLKRDGCGIFYKSTRYIIVFNSHRQELEMLSRLVAFFTKQKKKIQMLLRWPTEVSLLGSLAPC